MYVCVCGCVGKYLSVVVFLIRSYPACLGVFASHIVRVVCQISHIIVCLLFRWVQKTGTSLLIDQYSIRHLTVLLQSMVADTTQPLPNAMVSTH